MFGIQFESKEMKNEFVWQTSWGMTTRTIGVAVMMHGDNKGLVLPPKIAPVQVILIPILKSEHEKEDNNKQILEELSNLYDLIKKAGIRCKIDDRDIYTPGWKYNYWELKGVPIRLELGKKDIKEKKVVLCFRDNGEKINVPNDKLIETINSSLVTMHSRMYQKAKDEFHSCIKIANNNSELFKLITEKKMVKTIWCNTQECEDNVKKTVKETLVKIIEQKKKELAEGEEIDITEITAKTLCIPLEQDSIPSGSKCFSCEREAKKWVLWGKTY